MMSQEFTGFFGTWLFLEVLKILLIYVQDVSKKGSVSLGHEDNTWGLIDISKKSVNFLRISYYLGLG